MKEVIILRCGMGIPIKAEGEACHPDFCGIGGPTDVSHTSDEWYLRQLQAYKDWAGDRIYDTYCSRPHLLEKLK